DVPREQVTVVRQPVRERWSVVENVFVRTVRARLAVLDTGLEGPVGLPISQHVLFDVRERWLRRHTATTSGGVVESGSGVHLRAPRVRLSHGPPLLSRSTRGRNSPRRR